VLLTIGAGGLGAPRWVQNRGWTGIMRQDVVQHDHTGDWKYLWFAFIPHIMLPQRGANFAYPLAVLALMLVWMAASGASNANASAQTGSDVFSVVPSASARRSMLLHAAVFAGMLPLVQAHSFIGVGMIIGIVFLFDAHRWMRDAHLLVSWALAGAVAVATGYPQMSQFQHTVDRGFYGKFTEMGWLFKNYEFGEAPLGVLGFLRFWWYSLGPAVNLFLLACGILGAEALWASRKAAGLFVKDKDWQGSMAAAAAGGTNSDGVLPVPLSAAPTSRRGAASAGQVAGAIGRFTDSALAPVLRKIAAVLRIQALDDACEAANQLSPSGRAFDSLKFALGSFLVFLLGNYVRMQPWDRDNAKIFYIFIFGASPLTGALLAAPFEYLFNMGPGVRRIPLWLSWAGLVEAPSAAQILAASTQAGGAGNGTGSAFAAGSAGNSSSASGVSTSSSSAAVRRGTAAAGPASPGSAPVAVGTGSHGRGLNKSTMVGGAVSGGLAMLAIPLFILSTMSGFIMLYQESRENNGVLLDKEAINVGQWILKNTPSDAVILHSNWHVQPSGCLAGRPSLVAYYGWVSNHGYLANDRLGDRDYIMENALKDSDERADFLSRRWGVRYIVGEHMRTHKETANTRQGLFLGGKLKQVYREGRFRVLQVV
jgi:hypothetical protein